MTSQRLFGYLHEQLHAIDSPLVRYTVILLLIVATASATYGVARLLLFPMRHRAKRLAQRFPIPGIIIASPLLPCILYIVPLMTVGFMVRGLFCESRLTTILNLVVHVAFIFLCAHVFSALMRTLYRINNYCQQVVESPQKGIFQILALIGYLFAGVAITATVLGRDPTYVLSGLTALSAVLMLVFKDAILGFTAGIILAGNGMVKINDWIVVPGTDADGDVKEISLTTVRVQNFDKTITTIPAYDLVSKPFTNWRGMVEAGGRRIKRAIKIDLDSIHFATEEELARWHKIDLLKTYLTAKCAEIEAESAKRPFAKESMANVRHLTNIGTFRAYCDAYLANHPRIHQGYTRMVRQLTPDDRGLPLEIYCFTATTVWCEYEAIQSDVFDHLLAILPEFGLAAFQVTSAGALRRAFNHGECVAHRE